VDVGDAAATSGSLPAIGETQPDSATAARPAIKQRIFKDILLNTINDIKHILLIAQEPILGGTAIDFAHKCVRRIPFVRRGREIGLLTPGFGVANPGYWNDLRGFGLSDDRIFHP
jgi:hypothetical protein